MKVTDLIAQFARNIILPVDVNDVVSVIRAGGHDDKIEFIGVDLDEQVLLGKIKIFHVRDGVYGEVERWANIYYHRGLSPDWQRLIACKELLHLLDPESARTFHLNDINKLAEKIGLPPEMQDPVADGLATNVDRLAEFRAAAILLPYSCRQLFKPHLKSGALTLAQIAKIADIPSKYAGFVMSDVWEDVHPLLAGEQ